MSDPGRNRNGIVVAVLVVLGLIAGLGIGLLIGWVLVPVKYVDTSLADLHTDYKEEYTLLVASAYAYDHDLDKAQSRLEQLGVPNLQAWISPLIDETIDQGHDEAEIQALVALAEALGVNNPQMAAYLASPTPLPTDTPRPTPTPAPTDTPLPATDTFTPEPPTDTPVPQPTDTSVPQPTNTPKPKPTKTPVPQPTDTPVPQPTNTPKPKPTATNTPKPKPTATNTPKPAANWTWSAWLVGPGEDSQMCDQGLLQIRVMVVDANGGQIGGVWIYDKYSQQYQVTGNVDSPDYGPGETKFDYGIGGGGSLCIANGQGGTCISDFTRDMPCYNPPPFEDVWAAGYCNCCGGEAAGNKDVCRQIYDAHSESNKCVGWWGHYSWRVVFKRSW
jgi:hypothetical protein